MVTADSGAVDTVIPKTVATDIAIQPTKAANMGLHYRAANGTQIDNSGQKKIKGFTNEGDKTFMTMQVAAVKKPLGPIGRICEAHNKAVFDEEGSYTEDK